ncbi:amidohydrolase family protein [Microlunatus panaciterrae]
MTPDVAAVIGRSFSIADWTEAATASGVDRSIIVQTVTDPAETPEMLEIAAAHEQVAGVVGWLRFDDTVEAQIDGVRSGAGADKWVGVRDLAEYVTDPRWLASDTAIGCIGTVGAAGLTVDLLTRPHQLPAAVEAVRANPDVHFVVDHLSKPDIAGGRLAEWQQLINQLAPYENVACKVSGLVTEARAGWQPADLAPYVDTVLESFGPGRLMFGSDWPVCLLATDYAGVVAAAEALTGQLSQPETDQFWSGTATRWYRLDGDV